VLNRLPPKERQIVDLLYERGDMTAAEVADALPQAVSGSAVRTMLRRLEDKGFVRRSDSERVFFNGSATSAASALLGMSDRIDAAELDALEKMIADARKSKGQ